PGLLFRDHFFNQNVVERVIRAEYTALFFFIFILSLFFDKIIFALIGAAYLGMLTIRVFVNTRKANSRKNKFFYFFERLIFQAFLDISFWIGFLFFYPPKNELNYKSIIDNN